MLLNFHCVFICLDVLSFPNTVSVALWSDHVRVLSLRMLCIIGLSMFVYILSVRDFRSKFEFLCVHPILFGCFRRHVSVKLSAFTRFSSCFLPSCLPPGNGSSCPPPALSPQMRKDDKYLV